MRTFFVAISLAVLTATSALEARADEIVVVVHARNPSKTLSRADLRAMLTGNKAFWHGVVPVKAVLRTPTSEAGKTLFAEVLSMEPSQFSAQWNSRQLAGQGVAPETVGDAAAAMAKVGTVPGGLTIVTRAEAASAPANVKIIPVE